MHRLPLFLLLMLSSLSLFAQNGYWKSGATEAGMAYSTIAFKSENFLFHNVGILGLITKRTIDVNYDYRGFVEGLNSASIQVINPGNKINVGVTIFQTGDEVLNEFSASAGIGHKIGNCGIGLKINYYQHYSEAFGYTRIYSISAGGIIKLFPGFHWGTMIENPAQYGSTIEVKLPILFSTGFSYQPNEKLLITTCGEKNIDDNFHLTTGMGYNIAKAVTIRVGVDWYFKHLHYGLGFNLNRFTINYALSPLNIIGNVHSLSLQLKLSAL